MKFPIGFSINSHEEPPTAPTLAEVCPAVPRKSVVHVHFPTRNMTLSYYNDRFDLHRGDFVFVEGKLEGLLGRVVDVNYSFKIKLSDYKRVVAVADTRVSGEFFFAATHFVTFEKAALPFEKVITWFKAPANPEDEYVTGESGKSFALDLLEEMGVSRSVADRGGEYYRDNKVIYISAAASGRGYAIVESSKPYVVEFRCENGIISDLTCPCFCAYPCKHGFAAMLQLKDTLEYIAKHYAAEYKRSGYFAAMCKEAFMYFTVDSKISGSFIL